jgi:hypothetical protein
MNRRHDPAHVAFLEEVLLLAVDNFGAIVLVIAVVFLVLTLPWRW